jgi:hypothetical protein
MNNVLECNLCKPKQSNPAMLDLYVSECIKNNIEPLQAIVSVLKEGKEYAVQSFVYRILAAIMAEKDEESIGEWISSGTLFLLQSKLEEGFKKSLKL